jgi:hypothetical protein
MHMESLAQDVEIDAAILGTFDWAHASEHDRHVPLASNWLQEPLLASAIRDHGYVTRRDVFAVVDAAAPAADWTCILTTVNAWGYGKTAAYGHSRTQRIIQHKQFIASASQAAALLRDGQPVEAYFYLNNEGHVPGWGPAFFTKFLYFAGGAAGRALILDARLANAVNHLTPAAGFKRTGWTTPQYAYYLTLMNRIATDRGVHPDHVEAALFARF